jgi:hypothetical protein
MDPLSNVSLHEDPISSFLNLSECPRVLSVPVELNPFSGEVKRMIENLKLESVYDEYD